MGRVSRATRNIRWIERYCRVPEGKDVGKPLKLRPFQRRILRQIYNNPHGTRRAIVSMPKKNAKTSLAACLLLLHLVGPEARANSQLNSAAQSRDQAAILFGLAAKMVRMSPDLNDEVTIRDSTKQLFCEELGTLYRALSAEATTAHGVSPVFIVHDELGQVKGPRSELYEALETATGAHENPLSIVISTQARTDADLLSVLIDDATAANDPKVVVVLYTADPDPDLNPFTVKAIRQANPAYGDFLVATEVRQKALEAKRMPSSEASYRNLHLNQRITQGAPFLSLSVWKSCGHPVTNFAGLSVYGALDLSAVSDLTALVWIAFSAGAWHVKPVFWLPEHGLDEKAQADRVPYDLWRDQGFLKTTPGRTVEYEYVAEYLFETCREMDVMSIAFDRWNYRFLRPWLSKAGFKHWQVDADDERALFRLFGQGYRSMSPALRELESDLLNGKIAHGNHPVLTMCAANAITVGDDAGNRKLTKKKSTGRIDGMVALAMARGVAGDPPAPPQESVYNKRGLLVV